MEASNRKQLLLAALLLVCAVSVAQATDFVQDGKRWECLYYSNRAILNYDPPTPVVYYFEGDTIVQGKTCLKMYCDWEGYGSWLVGKFYEKESRVYYFPSRENAKSYLLYDFTAEAGDTLALFYPSFAEPPYTDEEVEPSSQYTTYQVLRTADPVIWQQPVHTLAVTSACLGYEEYEILEGLGTEYGPLGFKWFGLEGGGMLLNQCSVNGEICYQFTGVNPVSATEDDDSPCYDLLGRPVSPATPGLYIQHDRKVLVR